ncbi:MAG: hypothetical protein KAT65_11110 [Methanophagales archaeon]|nr:hypothetical protein [Methanophagales archaeon]
MFGYKGTDANSAIKKRSSAPNVFEEFKRNAEGGEKESFELWDDYLAWRFAEEARKFWSQEVQGLDALDTGI